MKSKKKKVTFRKVSNKFWPEKVKKTCWQKNEICEKIDRRKKNKLTKKLDKGDHVLVVAERLKAKDALGKFYKISTQNKSFFNNDKIFLIKKKK